MKNQTNQAKEETLVFRAKVEGLDSLRELPAGGRSVECLPVHADPMRFACPEPWPYSRQKI